MILFHKSKVGQCGNDSHAAAAGSEYGSDLRDHAGSLYLVHVKTAECLKCIGAFLKSQACTVDQTDHGSAHLHSQAVNRGDLLCVHLTHGSAKNGSVLAVYVHQISVNGAVTGDHTVCRGFFFRQVKVSASCCDIAANFHKALSIK